MCVCIDRVVILIACVCSNWYACVGSVRVRSSSFNVHVPCWHGLDTVWQDSMSPRTASHSMSVLARFLQLDALPSANHLAVITGFFQFPSGQPEVVEDTDPRCLLCSGTEPRTMCLWSKLLTTQPCLSLLYIFYLLLVSVIGLRPCWGTAL